MLSAESSNTEFVVLTDRMAILGMGGLLVYQISQKKVLSITDFRNRAPYLKLNTNGVDTCAVFKLRYPNKIVLAHVYRPIDIVKMFAILRNFGKPIGVMEFFLNPISPKYHTQFKLLLYCSIKFRWKLTFVKDSDTIEISK